MKSFPLTIPGTIFIITSILIIYSCKHTNVTVQKELLKVEHCNADTANTYCLYIPKHDSGCISMPLVVVLDPKGDGNTAIQKFIPAAEKYKCVIAASNLVRNNYMNFKQAIETVILDVRTKYSVGQKIYLAGFSGGARMAITFAQLKKVNGLLVSGALTMEDQIKTMNTNVYAIMGLGDFNLNEAADFILNPKGYPDNLKIELSYNSHEWPSSQYLSRGISFLLFSDYPAEATCINKNELSRQYIESSKKLIDSLKQSGDYLNSYLYLSNFQSFPGNSEKKYFKKNYEEVKNSAQLQNEIQRFINSMKIEFKARDAYGKALSAPSYEMWVKELNALRNQINTENDKYKKFAYKRLEAFLGIMCYSITSNYLKNSDLKDAGNILKIYKLIEPENPDMFYFSAYYLLKLGKPDSVAVYLQRAIHAGYNDKRAIVDNFPPKISNQLLTAK